MLVALFVEPDDGLAAVLAEVGDLQTAGRGDPGAGVQEKLQDGAVAGSERPPSTPGWPG